MTSIPRPEHPRPDWSRAHWLNLNGEWDFDFSEAERCPALSRRIVVPFSWASPLSGVALDQKGTAWYRRTARFDAAGRVHLVVGAADYETRVYVNGALAGEHVGGYGEMRFDVTDLWDKAGENEICVRVTDVDADSQTRGKQGYGEIRGIWQTVYLEEVPALHLDHAKIDTRIDGRVTVTATAHADAAGRATLAARFDGQTWEKEVELAAGETRVQLEFALQQPRLWSCEDPYLYEGELCLGEDRVSTYFGVREIGYAKFGGRDFPWITLNRKPVYLNGTLDQSFNPQGYFTLPDEADVRAEAQRLKDLGLNLVRLHIKPEEPRKLYWLDRLGILAFADMVCFWGEPLPETRAQFERELMEMLRRDCNHPSIMAWVVCNETWGLFTNLPGGARLYTHDTQEWVRGLYRRVKAFDPTRLVEDNSACNYDHVESDLNTWHFYLNGYMTVKEHIDTAAKGGLPGGAWNYTGGNRQYGVPLMNSECGMVWGVQDSAGDSDLAWQYHYMLNEYRLHENLCGFIFTEFHDVVNEFNGYYRIDNQRKYFGYDLLGMGMELNDLHARDFIAYDAPPCRTVGAGETVRTPVVHSSFGGVPAGTELTVEWFLHGYYGYVQSGKLTFTAGGDGAQALGEIVCTMPQGADVAALTFRLVRGSEVLSRNFCTFDVRGARVGVAAVEPRAYVSCEFGNAWQALDGHKVCGVGEGRLVYDIPVDALGEGAAAELRFEASAKVQLAKDANGALPNSEGADFMQGYRMDPGANHNSYFMTDEKRFPSALRVVIEGEEAAAQTLPDDPADGNGVLSWHYQKRERYLEEAGSYGYLVIVPVPEKALGKARARGALRVELCCDAGGLALYGRNAGRFPLDVELVER